MRETKGSKRPKRRPSGDYIVGYARPPVQHQFKTGQAQPAHRKLIAVPKSPDSLNDRAALRESRRKVELREGNRTVKISAYDASLRSLAVHGIKGSRLHATNFIARADRAQERHDQEANEWASLVYTIKENWLDLVDLHMARYGKMPRAPVPHPDDIRLHPDTGEYFIDGPRNHGEREELEDLVKETKKIRQKVITYRRRSLQDPANEAKMCLTVVHLNYFEKINGPLPRRYQIAQITPVA